MKQVPNVVLSIHPEHADAILDGRKPWEYRRVIPARGPPLRVVLYATAPVKAAIGVCWVPFIHSGHPAAIIASTIHETPHTVDELLDYFDGADEGHALRVMGPRRFDPPIERTSMEAAGAPPTQNFRYLPDVNPVHADVAGVTV